MKGLGVEGVFGEVVVNEAEGDEVVEAVEGVGLGGVEVVGVEYRKLRFDRPLKLLVWMVEMLLLPRSRR